MLPIALSRAIRLPLLTADPFTATKWDTGDDKAKFANHLLRFIAEDFPERLFTKAFYHRLCNTFGHIAHTNHTGFLDEFFRSRATKIEFLEQTITHPCYGDPGWTYSDVERAIIRRLKGTAILDWHHRLLAQEHEARDRAEYQRLARKFVPMNNPAPPERHGVAHIPATTTANITTATGPSAPPPHTVAHQPDLFVGF